MKSPCWHPESHYRDEGFGVDGLIFYEVSALFLFVFAGIVAGLL